MVNRFGPRFLASATRVGQRLDRRIGAHDQEVHVIDQLGDVGEVLPVVLLRFAEQLLEDRVRVHDAERVAVRPRLAELGARDGAAAAGLFTTAIGTGTSLCCSMTLTMLRTMMSLPPPGA